MKYGFVLPLSSHSGSGVDRLMVTHRSPHTLPYETSRRHHHRRHPHFTGKQTHLPFNAHFLERPQSAQRRLLRLGEPPDSRDIESLVWSIPSQRLERFTTL